jgi:uncharacterized glyoxalase superfamily protein PhnB
MVRHRAFHAFWRSFVSENGTNERQSGPDGTGGDAGTTTVRVEVFTDDPDALVARAVAAGADGDDRVREHQMPWGPHRQGGFTDPYGHRWLVGDRTPLSPHPR